MKRDNSPGHLSMPDTPRVVRECLDSIPDPVVSRGLAPVQLSDVGTCKPFEDSVVARVRRTSSRERDFCTDPQP